MTTATQLIDDACSEVGAAAQDTALSNYDAQYCLRVLNRMLASWATERLMVYALTTETFPTVAATASYSSTLLSGGRPVAVDSVTVTQSGVTYPVELKDAQDYLAIGYKAAPGTPEVCFAEMTYPNATFYLYPTPDAIYTVSMSLRRALSSTLLLATDLALPPGYEDAIVLNLATRVAGHFGTDPSPQLVENAKQAKATLKRLNSVPPQMITGFEQGQREGGYPRILAG